MSNAVFVFIQNINKFILIRFVEIQFCRSGIDGIESVLISAKKYSRAVYLIFAEMRPIYETERHDNAGVKHRALRSHHNNKDRAEASDYYKDRYKVYTYNKNGKLVGLSIRSSLTIPMKAYQYTTKGELEGVELYVSLEECYIFDEKGEFGYHWIGNDCYDKNGKWVVKEIR